MLSSILSINKETRKDIMKTMEAMKTMITTTEKTKDKDGIAIRHISFYSSLIETIGYDPQCAILEVKLLADDKIRRYIDVPEIIWYRFRDNNHPDSYFRRYICGRYAEFILSDEDTQS